MADLDSFIKMSKHYSHLILNIGEGVFIGDTARDKAETLTAMAWWLMSSLANNEDG